MSGGPKTSNTEETYTKLQYDPLVIAQLVEFVEFNHSTVKLADLLKLYDRRLEQLIGLVCTYTRKDSENTLL